MERALHTYAELEKMSGTTDTASEELSVIDKDVFAHSRQAAPDRQTVRPLASNNGNRKARTPPKISPPSLKRQRTDPGNRNSSPTAQRESLNLSFPAVARPLDFRVDGPDILGRPSSPTGHCGIPRRESLATCLPNTARRSNGFRTQEDDEVSTSSGMERSERSNKSGSSARTCRSCHKSITKSFDPLVLCTACHRPYHDACRKPPPAAGVDAKSWKCLKCIRKPTTSAQDPSVSESLQGTPQFERHFQTTKATEKVYRDASFATKTPVITRSDPWRGGYSPDLGPKQDQTAVSSRPSSSEMLHGDTVRNPELAGLATGEYLDLLQDDALERMIIEPMQPKPKPSDLEVRRRRSEIPDTPDQRSSQWQIDSTAPKSSILQAISSSNQTKDDTTFIVETWQQSTKPKFSKLCYVCKKQPVLAGRNSQNVRCMKCKKRAESLTQTQETIPETPVSMPPQSCAAGRGRPQSAVSGFNQAVAASPTTWLQSGFSSSNSKQITSKKVRPADISPGPKASQKEPALSDSQLRKPSTPTKREVPPLPETQAMSGEDARDSNVSAETESPLPTRSELDGDRSPLDVALDTSAGAAQSDSEASHSVLGENVTEQSTEAEVLGPAFLLATRDHLPQATSGLDSPASRVEEGAAQARSKPRNGQYTIKQLAGMALLTSDKPCSAAQVQGWVADNFSGYHKGKGGWERSIHSNLSGKDEFQAVKRAGDRFRMYAFADAASRAQFENMFGNHPAVKATKYLSKNAPIQAETVVAHEGNVSAQQDHAQNVAQSVTPDEMQLDDVQSSAEAAIRVEIPPATPEPLILPLPPSNNTPNRGISPINDENVLHDIDGVFMPFERADRFQCVEKADPPNVRRESSFWKAFPELAQPSVDTMSDVDIENKIKEIKSRPSKKAAWGKRLAFVRLHRKDVHDERAGAPKSMAPLEPRESQNIEMQDAGEPQSLKDIFDLPQNPIPILHNEQLAFRDGTLVNGKLPRSRVVYKVGRKFGPDLRLD